MATRAVPYPAHLARSARALTLIYRHPASYGHETGQHPENAGRIRAIADALDRRPPAGAVEIEPPAAATEDLERVHGADHIVAMAALCASGGGMIDTDTSVSEGSWEAALRASGGACDAVDRLLDGDARSAFCLMRPPGHHAERETAMGFCLVNHAAVAAAHALAHGVERVMILDWDVHHGNGTEEIFKDSEEVLYASIHQSPLYPGTGPISYVGEGAGEGFTVNLPVASGSGSAEFTSLVDHVAVPLAREFEPGLVIISAGFDAHRADPLASCAVETDAYAAMAASMADVARDGGAPVVVCLEGGYDPGALADSVLATLAGLASPRAGTADIAFAEPYIDRLREGRWTLA